MGGKSIVFWTKCTDTILSLKEIIAEKWGIPQYYQCLPFKGKILQDFSPIKENNITRNSTITLTSRLHGGARSTNGTVATFKDVIQGRKNGSFVSFKRAVQWRSSRVAEYNIFGSYIVDQMEQVTSMEINTNGFFVLFLQRSSSMKVFKGCRMEQHFWSRRNGASSIHPWRLITHKYLLYSHY